jgi:hypothetical protein
VKANQDPKAGNSLPSTLPSATAPISAFISSITTSARHSCCRLRQRPPLLNIFARTRTYSVESYSRTSICHVCSCRPVIGALRRRRSISCHSCCSSSRSESRDSASGSTARSGEAAVRIPCSPLFVSALLGANALVRELQAAQREAVASLAAAASQSQPDTDSSDSSEDAEVEERPPGYFVQAYLRGSAVSKSGLKPEVVPAALYLQKQRGKIQEHCDLRQDARRRPWPKIAARSTRSERPRGAPCF